MANRGVRNAIEESINPNIASILLAALTDPENALGDARPLDLPGDRSSLRYMVAVHCYMQKASYLLQ